MMSQGEEKDLERTMKNWAFSELLNFRSILKEQWLQAIICKFFLFVFFHKVYQICSMSTVYFVVRGKPLAGKIPYSIFKTSEFLITDFEEEY